jgi:phenylalanyl-tRNA synthetase beta chain
MKISYAKLQELFEDKLPAPEKLAEAFNFHFAEVESIEQEGDDTILDVKVLPDRAGYAKSYEGIALEASAILGLRRKASASLKAPAVRTVEFSGNKIREVLGTEVGNDDIVRILTNLDLEVTVNGDSFTLQVPAIRTDLQDWRDIPEEIARHYGYDKIPAKIPEKAAQPKPDKTFYYAEKVKNILVEKGYSEVYTYALTHKGVYHIEKSVAQDKNYLRANLTDNIQKSLELNVRNADLLGLDAISIFEIGNVFCEEGEHLALAIGLMTVKKKKGGAKDKDAIKVVRDELFAALGVQAQILCSADDTGGIISLNGKTVGITNKVEGIMELNLTQVIQSLSEPVSYDDLNFEKSVSITYKRFSSYPFMVRDIAVFVPEQISSDEVWNVIKKGIEAGNGAELLTRNALFDEFKKDGKISYAFRMVFQSMDRTLTDDEANAIMEKVNAEVKGKGWEVR